MPDPSPIKIIKNHIEAVDRGRRRHNARLFRLLLSALHDHGEIRRAEALQDRIEFVSHVGGDPATDPIVTRQYKAANKWLFDRHQRRHQPNPLPDTESVRRRDLWGTYKKAAKKLVAVSLECRLLMVTLTVSNRHSWKRRLEILDERRKTIRIIVGPHAVWYAEAFDVQGAPHYSPHAHILYLVPESACDGLSKKLREKARFRRHLTWVDHRKRDKGQPLLPDWKRRQEWLNRLAYIMKVSGDCGEREFLEAAWSREFQSVRAQFLKKAGREALNVQAMLVFHAGKRKRTFRAGIKIKDVTPQGAVPMPAPRRRARGGRGRPSTDPGGKKLREICRKYATMIARADALEMSVRSLRKWMKKHGVATPRGA